MTTKKKDDNSAKDVNEKVEEIKGEGDAPEAKTQENELEINPEEEAPDSEVPETDKITEDIAPEGENPDNELKETPEDEKPEDDLQNTDEEKPEDDNEEDNDPQKEEFGNGFFFIEDGAFFEGLSEKITDKQNIDDFSFVEAAVLPNKVRIMQRSEDWRIKTTSKRGDLKGKAGDFLLFDPNGSKLKVSGPKFRKLYDTLFGE